MGMTMSGSQPLAELPDEGLWELSFNSLLQRKMCLVGTGVVLSEPTGSKCQNCSQILLYTMVCIKPCREPIPLQIAGCFHAGYQVKTNLQIYLDTEYEDN